MKPKLSYANVTATIALFLSLCGGAYAAATITGREVRDGSLTGRDLRDGSVTARDLAKAVRAGAPSTAGPAGPVGATGAAGPTGAPGPAGQKGETGTVDTSRFYDKDAADARFLGVQDRAADAGRLDGRDAETYARGRYTTAHGALQSTPAFTDSLALPQVATVRGLCFDGPRGAVSVHNTSNEIMRLWVTDGRGQTIYQQVPVNGDSSPIQVPAGDGQAQLLTMYAAPWGRSATRIEVASLNQPTSCRHDVTATYAR